MKVLVTGATGFIGRHLTEALVAEGEEVRVLAQPTADASPLERLGVEVVRGDITDEAALARAVEGRRHVYHLAAKTPQPGLRRDVYIKTNTEGTKAVARAAIRAGIERLVYASSAGVYGIIRNPPVDERTKTNPTSAYRESKLAGEQTLRSLHEREGLPIVVARLPGVIGPGSLSWLGLFRAVASGRFRLIGAGENHDHTGYVSDVVDGLRLCARTPGVEGECYIIADKQAVKVRHLIEMISRELGVGDSRGRLPVGPYRAFNALGEAIYARTGFELPGVYRYALFLADKVLDISKAERELGYRPKVPVEEGVRRTVRWCREQGYV